MQGRECFYDPNIEFESESKKTLVLLTELSESCVKLLKSLGWEKNHFLNSMWSLLTIPLNKYVFFGDNYFSSSSNTLIPSKAEQYFSF